MRNKVILAIVGLLIAIAIGLSVGFIVGSADDGIYTFQDESCNATFTILDESTYSCEAISTSGDVVNFNGTYKKDGDYIAFYLGNELFIEANITEGNVLVEIETEPEDDTNKGKTAIYQLLEYIFAGIIGLFGTGALAIYYKDKLNSLVEAVKKVITNITKEKEVSKTEIDDLKQKTKEAHESLLALRDEIREELKVYTKVLATLSSGMKELVANGTAEEINNIVKELGDGQSKEE
jgi:hypothetical protein